MLEITEQQLKEHENRLTEIYKKLFGFHRITDEESKQEIELEARTLAVDLSKETKRFLEDLDIAAGTQTNVPVP